MNKTDFEKLATEMRDVVKPYIGDSETQPLMLVGALGCILSLIVAHMGPEEDDETRTMLASMVQQVMANRNA